MLWDDNLRAESGQPAHDDNHDDHEQRFRVNVVLLHAKTGVATGRELASPALSEVVTGEQAGVDGGGGGGSVAAAFSYGGASAMDYAVPFLSAE